MVFLDWIEDMMDHQGFALTRRAAIAGSVAGLMSVQQARAQGIAPKKGGTLNTVLTPEPPILILGINGQGPTLICATKIYQGLLKFSPKLEPLPELAKSWELSEDKRSYTFHLQDNVKFHDGVPMTADDVLFSVMKFHMEVSPRARSIFAKIEDAKVVDPHTVVFTLKTPFEPFLLMFEVTACAIMPKHIFDGTDYRNNPHNQTPIGTGPFRFAEWQRGNFIRLARFDEYWKPGQPYLDEIIYRIVPDSQSRALALQTGQVVMTAENDIEPFDVPRFKAMGNLEVNTNGWEYFAPVSWFEINNRVKPLDDKRVRQAMSHAIDRSFILNRLWFGVGRVATSPIASTTRFHDPESKLQAHDPKMAMQLLDAAGLKPDAKGVRFSIRHLVLPYGEVWTRLGEYFRTAMHQVGIDVQLESTDAGAWARRIADWDYDTSVNFVYQYGDPTLGVERTYVSTNIKKITFTNTGGYSNPKVDELFAKAGSSADANERRDAFYEAQRILIDEIPQIWTIELTFPTIYERKVHNPITTGTGIHACYDDVFLT